MKNQNGFSYVLLIGLLPILLGLFFALFTLKAWLLPEQKIKHICRVELLRTQNKVVTPLQHLLKLNDRVKQLRQIHQQADIALKAAYASANPEAIALALTFKKTVVVSQKMTRGQQLYYLAQANLAMQKGVSTARSDVEKAIEEFSSKYHQFFEFSGHVEFTWPHKLAVRTISSSEPGPPVYELEKPFTNKQSLQVSWRYDLSTRQAGVVRWFHTYIKKSDTCRASLLSQDEGMSAVLMADKFL